MLSLIKRILKKTEKVVVYKYGKKYTFKSFNKAVAFMLG